MRPSYDTKALHKEPNIFLRTTRKLKERLREVTSLEV